MKMGIERGVMWALGACVVLLVTVSVHGQLPADQDAWTENNASEWGRQFGAGTVSDDTADSVVGEASIKYEVPQGSDGEMHIPFDPPLDASAYDTEDGKLVFWAKVDDAAVDFGPGSWIELQGPTTSHRLQHRSTDVWDDAGHSLTTDWQEFEIGPISSSPPWSPVAAAGSSSDVMPNIIKIQMRLIGPSQDVVLWVDGLHLAPEPATVGVLALATGLAGLGRRRMH